MRYLIIDALLNGTGIRDQSEGGYASPKELGLSDSTVEKLRQWLNSYEDEHYNGFNNIEVVNQLDDEGKDIARLIAEELKSSAKVKYYSNARLQELSYR